MKEATSFGKYELLSRLARGGMAETFRARLTGEAGVTKEVVIKKMLGGLAQDEGFVAAFISEAKLSARFNHPNIAQIFDFGEQGGEYFLAMEFVDGRSLAELLARAAAKGMQQLPEPIACFIAMEILKGLHYAHTREGDDGRPLKIVHRDVSPDNVLVSFEGDLKVVDFGIAKAAQRGRRETQAGLVKGKFLYFSPEQAEAQPLDGRSDQFAVGILLYRMLCGVLPFEGQMHVAVAKILTGDFRPPRVLAPALSPALAQIVTRALQPRRDERFESALKMQEALSAELFRADHAFSSETLKELVGWLFAEERAKSGAPASSSRRLEAVIARGSMKKLEPVVSKKGPGVLTPIKLMVAIVGGLLGIALAHGSMEEKKPPVLRPMLRPGPMPTLVPSGPMPDRVVPGPLASTPAPAPVRRVRSLPATLQLDREHRVRFDPQYTFNVAGGQELRFEPTGLARTGPAGTSGITAVGFREAGPQYVPVQLGGRLRFDGPTRLTVVAPVIDGVPVGWDWPTPPGTKQRERPLRPAVRPIEEHEGLWAVGLTRENNYRVELTSKQTGLLVLAVGKPEHRVGMGDVKILTEGTWKPAGQVWTVPSSHEVSGVTLLWLGILSIPNDPQLTLSIVDLGPRPGANKDPLFAYPAPSAVDRTLPPGGYDYYRRKLGQ